MPRRFKNGFQEGSGELRFAFPVGTLLAGVCVICSFLWLYACVHGVWFDCAWILRVSMGMWVGGCLCVHGVHDVWC